MDGLPRHIYTHVIHILLLCCSTSTTTLWIRRTSSSAKIELRRRYGKHCRSFVTKKRRWMRRHILHTSKLNGASADVRCRWLSSLLITYTCWRWAKRSAGFAQCCVVYVLTFLCGAQKPVVGVLVESWRPTIKVCLPFNSFVYHLFYQFLYHLFYQFFLAQSQSQIRWTVFPLRIFLKNISKSIFGFF